MADQEQDQDEEMDQPDQEQLEFEQYLQAELELFEKQNQNQEEELQLQLHDQEHNQQQETEPETEPAKRGRGRPKGRGRGRPKGRGRGRPEGRGKGRGRGRDTENATSGGEEDEAAAPGGGRGRGRGGEGGGGGRGGGGGGGGGKGDFAIRETEAGSNEWRAKCYQAHKETDHIFLNKTAAAVAFDISHIIALQRGFCKTGGRKGGCYMENASKQILQDLVDVKRIKSYQRNGSDDLHSAVLVISKMVDAFLTGIRSKEDAEGTVFFSEQDPKDTHIIQLCFYTDKLSSQRHMRDVPGLEEIVQKHLEVLVEGLPVNPTAVVPAVVPVYSDDDEQNGGAARFLPPPPPEEVVVAVHPSGRPRRSATARSLKSIDGKTPAKKVTPEKRKVREDKREAASGSKKQRKKDISGGGGGDDDGENDGSGGGNERPDFEEGPYLFLDVCTECPSHGSRKTTHYHFAHDCVCEAKKQMRECFDFINLDPSFRAYLNDFQLPPCFQEWKHRFRNSNAGGVGVNPGGLNDNAGG